MENLRRKPTYNELINYLEFQQPKVKYPNRNASFLRNSHYLSQFDGDSWIDIENQQEEIMKEKLKEIMVKQLTNENGRTASLVRVKKERTRTPSFASVVDAEFLDSDGEGEYSADQQRKEAGEQSRVKQLKKLFEPKDTSPSTLTAIYDWMIPSYITSGVQVKQEPLGETPDTGGSASSVGEVRPRPSTPKEKAPETTKIEYDNEVLEPYWWKQNTAYIKKQLEMRGIRIRGYGIIKRDLIDEILKAIKKNKRNV